MLLRATPAHAQFLHNLFHNDNHPSQTVDSAARARQHVIDSTREARQHTLDSIRIVREHRIDSVKEVRQQRADSLATIRAYRSSRHYKDSVQRVRQNRIDSIKAIRKAHFDSLRVARQHIIDSTQKVRQHRLDSTRKAQKHQLDSLRAYREHRLDSIKVVRKHRTDSLDAIRRYRNSRHYKDSVEVFRKARLDSIRTVRKHFTDSLVKARKHYSDSLTKVRKEYRDSVTKVRTQYLDSMKTLRKHRADSLATVRQNREKELKVAQKKREEKKQLALDLKIKQQREAWSNEKMLKKKWSIKRRIIQNTFTRYNYYFNANKKMDEALANMQRFRKEDYDKIIGLYPFNPDKDSSLLSSDMDSIIHKASVGIQIHDPRTKWADDLYLLLGEAYYYKGHYEDAETAFHYIISMDERRKKKGKHGHNDNRRSDYRNHNTSGKEPSIVQAQKKSIFDIFKHKPVHNKAILWLARTYTQAKQPEKTESVLALLEADPNFPENLKGRFALEKAFLYLHDSDDKRAASQLVIAANDKYVPNWIRLRAAFLSGQLLQQEGKYKSSVGSFQKVLDLNPKIDMDFYARKYLAYGAIYGRDSSQDAENALKNVIGDAKYASYYEQVYYMLGRIAANKKDDVTAVDYFEKGLHAQKTTRKQKALTFAALGNVYYSEANYVAANNAYDSSATFASAAPDDSTVILAVARGKALDAVTGPATTIHDQDSLLALSLLSDKEQRSIARKYIKHLEQLRSDSIYNAENAGIASVAAAEPVGGSTPSTWYFSNPVTMKQGYNAFKQKWGDRPLVDNWRRAAAIGISTAASGNNNNSNSNDNSDDENSGLDENGLPTEESLLAAVPNSSEQKQKAYKQIETAYMQLGNAYVMDLKDYPLAIRTLDTMEKRFPATDKKEEILYLRYVVALREDNLEKAKKYREQIQSDYPGTKYAKLVTPAKGPAAPITYNGYTVGEYYDSTYSLMMDHQYPMVIDRVNNVEKYFKDTSYTKRFQIVKAIALAKTGEYGKADTILSNFIKAHPKDSLRNWVDAIMEYINKNKPVAPPPPTAKSASNNVRGIGNALNTGSGGKTPQGNSSGNVPNTQPGNNSNNGNQTTSQSTNANPNAVKGYTYNPAEQHYFVVEIPGLESRAMGVKAALSDLNSFKFSNDKLILNMDVLSPKEAMIVAKSFKNAATAKAYLKTVEATPTIFREYSPGQYHIFIISASNYTKLFSDHSINKYLFFYQRNYK